MVDLEKKLTRNFNTSLEEYGKNMKQSAEESKQFTENAVKGTYQRIVEQMNDLEKRVGLRQDEMVSSFRREFQGIFEDKIAK